MIPDISYLILNYNPDGEAIAQEVLSATIDTFYARKSRHLTCDVCLLDQGSVPRHQAWLLERQRQFGFSSLLLNRNIGISRAINFFARICKSPVIGLITSDVLITSGMDEDLFNKVQIPEVYQATPCTDKSDVDYQVWVPSGTLYGSDDIDLARMQCDKRTLGQKLLGDHSQKYIRCIGVEFNVMFWRKSIFERIGYYDEQWKASYENNDFSLRCFLDGGCTAISKESFVWHYHKVTEKNLSKNRSHDGYLTNWEEETRRLWDAKWPNLSSYINIYKLLGNKTIQDFPTLRETFEHNIYLSSEQAIDYY